MLYLVYMEQISRILPVQKCHFFLLGPRGTGKTTWLRNVLPEAAWVDLLDGSEYRRYSAYPEKLAEFIAGNRSSKQIIIDEIQRVPLLLPVVHQQIELNKDIQFILTGSSARKLRQEGVDLLGGRAVQCRMPPFLASELKERFSIDTALTQGMLPLVSGSPDPVATLKGYIDIYIQQEIKAEALIRKIDAFNRFIEAVSFSQANVLNISNVARECEMSRQTVGVHLSILEDLLLCHLLPVFTKRAKRSLVSHPKFFYFDCGVYRSIRPSGPLDNTSAMDEVCLETLVFQHLKAFADITGDKLHYWRTPAGSEVDFILYGRETFAAIEVKNTLRIRPEHLRSLNDFKTDYPEARVLLLYRGHEKMIIRNVLCLPVAEFLVNLNPNCPWPE
jgi:predicted AAA+ superfamily ATPase